jgi:hypothetical protein
MRFISLLTKLQIEVHQKFRCVPETLYLTINLIDRYLELEQVERSKLQLVGVTALLVSGISSTLPLLPHMFAARGVISMDGLMHMILRLRTPLP